MQRGRELELPSDPAPQSWRANSHGPARIFSCHGPPVLLMSWASSSRWCAPCSSTGSLSLLPIQSPLLNPAQVLLCLQGDHHWLLVEAPFQPAWGPGAGYPSPLLVYLPATLELRHGELVASDAKAGPLGEDHGMMRSDWPPLCFPMDLLFGREGAPPVFQGPLSPACSAMGRVWPGGGTAQGRQQSSPPTFSKAREGCTSMVCLSVWW